MLSARLTLHWTGQS